MEIVLDTDHVADGYEPRCSVCNCEFQGEIEAMRENDRTFDEIRHFMDINGIKISLMALSRHFSKHYPQRKLYLEHMECRQVKVDKEVGLKIDEILNMHPYMDSNYFQDNSTFRYKNIEGELESFGKSNKEIFMEDYGFCHTYEQLCTLIPAKEATYPHDLSINYRDKDHVKYTAIKIQCLECKLNHQDILLSHLLGIMSRILLDLVPDENTN